MPRVPAAARDPKSTRPATGQRRLSREEERLRYRREVLCLPGPIDAWIQANTSSSTCARARSGSGSGSDPRCPLAAEEVCCMLQMQRTRPPAPADGGVFEDPETFTLYLALAGPAGTGDHPSIVRSRRMVLQTYEGWPESLDAPDWAAWRPGQTVTFRQRRVNVAAFLRAAVRSEDIIALLIDALASFHV
ncbi:hypothetical protein BKA93DRAFT_826291 [Sparassis latifolia]